MDNVCRVCARSNVSLMDIFSKFGIDGLRPADMLIETVDCNLYPNDAFPNKICLTCVVATQKTFELKRNYQQSHQHFLQLLKINDRCNETNCEEQTNPQTQYQEAEEIEGDSRSLVNEEVTSECQKFEVEETEMEDNQMNEVLIKRERVDSDEEEMDESQLQEMEIQDELIKNETTFMESDLFNNYNNGKQLFTHFCDTCHKGFPNNARLIQHSLDHFNLTKNHQCPYCPKFYRTRQTLNRHVVVHSGEEPYKCPHCPRSFCYKATMDRHIQKHLGVRPYQCSDCTASFAYSVQLKNHQLYEHLGKRSKCDYCPMAFKSDDKLRKHMRVHSKDRPFLCPQCPCGFFKKGSLTNHMALHLAEHPFKCEDCLKTFPTRGAFNQHIYFLCKMRRNTKKEKSHAFRTRYDTRVKNGNHES